MRSKGHTHHELFAICRNPVNASLTLMIALLVLIFLLLFLFIMEQPVQAQTTVPPTAVRWMRQGTSMRRKEAPMPVAIHPAAMSSFAAGCLRSVRVQLWCPAKLIFFVA
ncbi:MAG TPA: hypothetical protein VKB58_13755 [Terriglobales bacterium]|jgi:hypothetical protein|nr:hypothetical protein [Terriglobales bacterium]